MTEVTRTGDRPAPINIAPTPRRSEETAAPTAKPQQDKTESTTSSIERQREKIFGWFAKAGINTGQGKQKKVEVQQRANRRQSLRAEQRVANLERIMQLAGDFALSSGKEEALDPDWFFSFIDMAEDIYSPGMQELWAKILAVEVGRPGSFTLRTLQTLKQLTQKDAVVLEHAARLIGHQAGGSGPKILSGYSLKPSLWSLLGTKRHVQINLAEFGLSYPQVLALVDMGLLYSSEIESGELPVGKTITWRFGKSRFDITARRSGLVLKYYKFTHTGGELMRLIREHTHEDYLQQLKTTMAGHFSMIQSSPGQSGS